MLQFIISLALSFVGSLLKAVTKNPKVAAEEAGFVHDVATDATQADSLVGGGAWTYTPPPPVSTSAAD
jgi:hypothetical protein